MNLFENAKRGDIYLTRNGVEVIFIGQYSDYNVVCNHPEYGNLHWLLNGYIDTEQDCIVSKK